MLPFKIHDSWFIITFLSCYQLITYTFPLNVPDVLPTTALLCSLLFPVCLFFSVFCHESGHKIAAQHFKVETPYSILFPFGTVYSFYSDIRFKSAVIILVAGPLASFSCALFFYGIAHLFFHYNSLYYIVLEKISQSNLFIAGITLLPLLPFDGGIIISWIFHQFFSKPSTALKPFVMASWFFSYGILFSSIYYVFRGHVLLAIWIIIIGKAVIEATRHYISEFESIGCLQKKTIGPLVERNPVIVPVTTSLYDFVHHFMYQYGNRVFPVVKDTFLEGYIDFNKIGTFPFEAWKIISVRSIVKNTDDSDMLHCNTTVINAIKRMLQNDTTHALVTDYDNTFLGILHMQDILCAIDHDSISK